MVARLLDWFNLPSSEARPGHTRAVALLALILVITLALNLWKATLKLFWFDEVTSVATVLSPHGIWAALQSGIDSSAPLFAVLESWARHAPFQEHISYRLPSILALVVLSGCMFAVFRRLGPLSALIAATFPLITVLQSYFSIEARAYEVLVCFAAVAWLSWTRASRHGWVLSLGLSLAAAVSVHYLAVLIFLPFAVGEAARWFRTRQFRISVWGAMLAGGAPLIFFWPLLASLKTQYFTAFWSKPNFLLVPGHYDWLVDLGYEVGSGLALVIGIGLLILLGIAWRNRTEADPIQVEDVAVSFGFLLLPVASYLLAKVEHGGDAPRYAIPMLLGIAGGAAQLAYWVGRRASILMLVLILAIFSLREGRGLAQNIGRPTSVAALPPEVVEASTSRGLPLVIGSAIEYLPLAYYNQGKATFLFLADRQAAIQYIGTDSVDLNLSLLRDFLPVDVQSYPKFRQIHSSFLLYASTADRWSWWPGRLAKDGRSLQPILVHLDHTLFLVN
jgi:hypothetical protein